MIRFEKNCPKCGTVKPLTDFPSNAAKPDHRGDYCSPCAAADSKERRVAKQLAYDRAVAGLSPEDRARLGR